MSGQIVVIENKNLMQVFTDEKGLDPYVKMIKDKVKNHNYDVSTKKGRDEIKSLAHNVGKSKVYLDDLGKELVSGWKKQSKKVDDARKGMRDELIALKEEARQPLNDWEAEEDEKERIFQEKAAALKLAQEIENDHEIGLLLDEKYDREIAMLEQKEFEAEKERQRLTKIAQKEHDEQIAKEAKEQAEKEKVEAEAKAKQAELDKIAIQEKADRDAVAAKEREKQAKIDADNAEKKRLADVKRAEEEATQREIDRQADEQAKAKAEQEKLEKDKKHVGAVRGEIKAHLIKSCKIDEPLAKNIVLALLKTDRITINY